MADAILRDSLLDAVSFRRAEREEAKLAEREAWFQRGPEHARVVSVERKPAWPEVCRGFEIR